MGGDLMVLHFARVSRRMQWSIALCSNKFASKVCRVCMFVYWIGYTIHTRLGVYHNKNG